MAVTSTTARTTVLITGLPQVIPVFEFNVAADLIVLDGGALNVGRDPATTLTLGSDYTVSGGGYNTANQLQTGAITVVAGGSGAVLAGDYITILRNITLEQDTSFVSTGPRTPLLTEQDDDRLTTIAQEQADGITRSLRAPPQENLDWVMPNATARISSFPFFDSNGDLTLYTLADILAALSSGSVTVAANRFYAGPTSGAAATPTFRAITNADLTGLTGFANAGAIGSSNLTMTTGKLLGRTTGLTGAIEEITPGTSLTFSALALNTVQDIRTTAIPTWAGVIANRSDNGYGYKLNNGSKAWGLAASGNNFLFDLVGIGTIWAIDASGNYYLSRLTTNGTLRTGGGGGVVTVDAFGQLTGTATNNNAAAGCVGEIITAVVTTASPVSVTTSTVTDLTSITLTPGDWDVTGVAWILQSGTAVTNFQLATNDTALTQPAIDTGRRCVIAPVSLAGFRTCSPIPASRYSVSVNTTVYVNVSCDFASGTVSAGCYLRARRVR